MVPAGWWICCRIVREEGAGVLEVAIGTPSDRVIVGALAGWDRLTFIRKVTCRMRLDAAEAIVLTERGARLPTLG